MTAIRSYPEAKSFANNFVMSFYADKLIILLLHCEGALMQEFNALYVSEENRAICIVFHTRKVFT